jgi:hypothetical protein
MRDPPTTHQSLLKGLPSAGKQVDIHVALETLVLTPHMPPYPRATCIVAVKAACNSGILIASSFILSSQLHPLSRQTSSVYQ